MSGPVLGLGIIGCGAVAQAFHLPAVRSRADCRLASAADPDEGARQWVRLHFRGTRVVADYRDWLGDPEVDAVIVATPPHLTAAVARDCIHAGKHVLCEKPIATALGDADSLKQAVRTSGRVFQVGFIFRFNSGIRQLREWIAAGLIGSPAVLRLGTFNEPWMSTDPAHNERMIDILRSSTPLVVGGAHLADMMRQLIPSPAVCVCGVAARTRPDLPQANHWLGTVEFADGSIAKLEMAWLHPIAAEDERQPGYPQVKYPEIEIFGPSGIAWHDLRTGLSQLVQPRGTRCAASAAYELNFDAQLEAFVNAVRRGGPVSPGVDDGYESLAVTLALDEAVRTRTIIQLNAAACR